MIGDRLDNDIEPAKNAGMHTVWGKQGFAVWQKANQPEQEADYTVNNLSELKTIL